jgi:Xaa-Pro dipeptidase
MDFDSALELIAGIDGSGVDLGERSPVAPDFPIAEYRRRYARLVALMDEDGLQALVITQEEGIRYLSGYNSVVWAVGRWLPTVLVATRDPRQALLIGSIFDAGCAAGTAWVGNLRPYNDMDEISGAVFDHLSEAGIDGAAVGFELGRGSFQSLPYFLVQQLFTRLDGPPRDASRLLSTVRMLKSPAEIERQRRSVGAAVAGYRAGLEAARPGMSEKEIVAIIAAQMFRSGATAGTRPVFVNSVSGRERYPLVDTPASDRRLADGDIVFIDGGAATDGYVSDILRLIGVGLLRPADRHFAEVAAAATAAMTMALRPGLRVSELFDVGAGTVARELPGEEVGVIAGHGIGLELWERPFLRRHADPADDVTIRAGMVLCVEPIIAPAHPEGGLAGVFVFEQQVLVTDAGCEILSGDLPAQLWEVG